MSCSFTQVNPRQLTLVVCGPTRIGKTTFVRSVIHASGMRHMYMNGHYHLDEWDPTAEVIVMDDLPLHLLRQRKQWWGCQHDFVTEDKYRVKRKICGGKGLVWICNRENLPWEARKDGRPVLGWDEEQYFRANCTVVELGPNKLFRVAAPLEAQSPNRYIFFEVSGRAKARHTATLFLLQ